MVKTQILTRSTGFFIKSLAVLCLLLLWHSAHAMTLTAFADRNSINLNDQLIVTFQLRDATSTREPDFSPIQASFDILANHRSTMSMNNNGIRDQYYEWRLTLSPKRYGQLTIPSISLGNASTQPIAINVIEIADIANSSDNIFMQVTVDKKSVYVQEQVLVSIKLFSKFDWRGKELQVFELDNAIYEAVSENEYITKINGTPHVVYEVILAIYPQKSGSLVFPSLEFAVQLRGQRRSLLSFGSGPISRVHSTPINISVKPIPANNGTSTWLPAKSVQLQQHWSHNIASLVAGEPVTRTITMTAEGLSKSQLPPLNIPEHPEINAYTDQEQTDEERSSRGITSQRIETVAMVPNRAGRITLPAVEVKWWNTEKNTYEIARIPEQTLTATMPLNAQSVAIAQPPQITSAASASAQEIKLAKLTRALIITQIVTGVLLLLFITLYIRGRTRKSTIEPQKTQKNYSDKIVWQLLKRAASSNNLPQVRENLLLWAENHWQTPIRSLAAIAQHANDPTLGKLLELLDQNIYAGSNTEFNAEKLLQSIQALRIAKRDKTEDPRLKTLYPS